MTKPVRTLIVDDDEGVLFVLSETLGRSGHAVTGISSGQEALDRLRDTPFDLAILDLKLDGRIDGLRILEAIKWRWPQTATIILTAHGSLDSALVAIRERVDGYLLKPVKPEEIRRAAQEALERRQAEVRSEPKGKDSLLESGPFTIDLERRHVTLRGTPLDVTGSELDLLIYLVQNTHRVVSPQELVQVVRQYKPDSASEARDIIKWYIYRLRRKVEPEPARPRHILNVRGFGYIFKE